MSGQKKNNDPLSRLLDPTKDKLVPLPAIDEASTGTPIDPTNMDEPHRVVSPRASIPLVEEEQAPELHPPVPVNRPPPPPASSAPPVMDPHALARSLARAAAARAAIKAREAAPPAPQAPTPEPEPRSRLAAAPPPPVRPKTAAEILAAMAHAPEPEPEPAPPTHTTDQSVAAQPVVAPPTRVAAPVTPSRPAPRPAPPPEVREAEGEAERRSRLAAAPPPQVRPKTAAEILAAMAQTPEEPEPAPEPIPERDIIADTIAFALSRLGNPAGLHITACVAADNRALQIALWKGHRSRFLASNDIALGVATNTVLHHLEKDAPGTLLAARAELGERTWLVWLSTETGPIVAFPNASLWFAW